MTIRVMLLVLSVLAGSLAAQETVRLGAGDLLGGIPGEGDLSVEAIRAWLAERRNHRPLRPLLPIGLDAAAANVRGLEENPLTRAKIELGRQLFFDPRLSVDGTVSCASCHDPRYGYAFPSRFGIGVGGREGARHSQVAFNRIVSGAQFWDGRAESLEEQAVGPIANPAEMAFSHEAATEQIENNEGYRLQFEAIFGAEPSRAPVSIDNVARAIASFERAVVTGPSAWDRHQRLEEFRGAYAGELDDPVLAAELKALEQAAAAAPLSEPARRGARLFFDDRSGCAQCHAGANFTDERYHNLGVGMEGADDPDDEAIDWGRFVVTGVEDDRGAFKTPTLRNVAQTAPYMHDGSQQSLAEVVQWYAQGGHDNRWISPLVAPIDLTDQEQADLVEFLEALTGELPPVETGRLP